MNTAMGFTSAAVTPDSAVKAFSGGERQGVAITRALYFNAELIILDEPTMGLSMSETKKCLDFVQGIKQAGKSAIFIDHNIFHVHPVADRIVVLDRGTVAGQFRKDELTLDGLLASCPMWLRPEASTTRRARTSSSVSAGSIIGDRLAKH